MNDERFEVTCLRSDPRYSDGLWAIMDLENDSKCMVYGPKIQMIRLALLLNDSEVDARCLRRVGELYYSIDDYRNAPSGDGPLAVQWVDKPHRLLYDLCIVLEGGR